MSRAAELLLEALGRGLSSVASSVDPDLPALLAESEGRRLALVVRGFHRRLEVEVRDGALRVLPLHRWGDEEAGSASIVPGEREDAGAEEPYGPGNEAGALPHDPDPGPGAEPDLVLSGTVSEYLRFLRTVRAEPDSEDVFGSLDVAGVPEARAGFVDLLRRVDPDYEALLARVAGGVVAHAVARSPMGRWVGARRSAAWFVDEVTEYLTEEVEVVPDTRTGQRFAGDVRALLDKVAELEERLERAAGRG